MKSLILLFWEDGVDLWSWADVAYENSEDIWCEIVLGNRIILGKTEQTKVTGENHCAKTKPQNSL